MGSILFSSTRTCLSASSSEFLVTTPESWVALSRITPSCCCSGTLFAAEFACSSKAAAFLAARFL
uniref:Uncharacterized protein n=1 Tax=Rhizophora mucronata TaxID=61149 RepID=A0A2P2P3J6_RHIMU